MKAYFFDVQSESYISLIKVIAESKSISSEEKFELSALAPFMTHEERAEIAESIAIQERFESQSDNG